MFKRLILLLALAGFLAVIAGGITWYMERPRYKPLPPRPELTIRIREGESARQLATRLVQLGVASSTTQALDYWGFSGGLALALADLSTSTQEHLGQILPSGNNLEGYLFPDTYRVWQDMAFKSLTAKALTETVENLEAELRTVAVVPQNFTPHQVLTLASIIEREVPSDADRTQVADVFIKRLAIGMALQSDATVNYVTNKSTTRPSAADLAVSSAYNTYQNRGLPPGPIAFPSRSSIHAVLHPTANPYYFFLTTPDGQVIYSRTGAEHSAAKKKYLK
jgi:UPF0755 protein